MRVSVEQFTHDKAAKTFTAEASDLSPGWMSGVTLVHPKRLTTASFFIKETHWDEGHEDITHWTLTSSNPRVAGYRVVILND